MAGAAEGPTYLSSRSADVILSDIRPTKFNTEALRCTNVLLDEFLYGVLNAARSLTPHQLRAGLLKVLPTTLGKEALLEAEMELRAYLERTGVSAASVEMEEKGNDFNLQWSFELLRLKCQAYSTLSDSDEDPQAEARLIDRLGESADGATPQATLVAPAALYLTAILESVCEHVLSNVGRVATRDSSRATATVQDLYVALCEDDSIYGLFKTMKGQSLDLDALSLSAAKIENLCKGSKPRRSKSLSRSAPSPVRTSSPQQGESASLPSRSHRSELESTGSMATAVASAHAPSNPRSSFDKARAIKMFSNNRASDGNVSANDGSRLHKRSDSILSDSMKQTIPVFNGGSDAASLGTTSLDDQEFDNMMRSDSTMKVSLTPDRLKSMEIFTKEKNQKGSRKVVPKSNSKGAKSSKSSPPNLLKRANSRQLSIAEDEEYKGPNGSRTSRQANSQNNASTPPVSASARVSAPSSPTEKYSHANKRNLPTNSPSFVPSSPSSTHDRGMPSQQTIPGNGFPPRTRNIQRNRESLDLDDIIGDEDQVPKEPPKCAPRGTARVPLYPVSAGARDLIEFLAEGPPNLDPLPGPADSSMSLDTPGKAKGGRLQRMISKLTLKDDDRKFRGGGVDSYPKSRRTGPTAGQSSLLQSPPILAPKPVPPRPPPISPPSPPSSPSQHSLVEPTDSARPRRQSTPRKPATLGPTTPQTTSKPLPGPSPVLLPKELKQPPKVPPSPSQIKYEDWPRSSGSRTTTKQLNGTAAGIFKSSPEHHSSKTTVDDAKPRPAAAECSVLVTISDNARDMHRLLARATNADECRLIVDLFLAKSNLLPNAEAANAAYPSPPSDNNQPLPSAVIATNLENNLVELFLGGGGEEYVEGDEEPLLPLSPITTNSSKDTTPVTLPVSPPDTPLPSHLNVTAAILQKVSRDTLPVNSAEVVTS